MEIVGNLVCRQVKRIKTGAPICSMDDGVAFWGDFYGEIVAGVAHLQSVGMILPSPPIGGVQASVEALTLKGSLEVL
ncbi:MAG: hypothetical protein QOD84_1560 [Acidobacteriaceae bacterium]|jgi:hypothetical protein